jgi:hypothetical protein
MRGVEWVSFEDRHDLIGSGGIIRNYNHRNFREIFFDYDSLRPTRKAIH